ncbi:hypothetical protein SLEP1_g40643 [Rubroshorea leprosula]|uniref:Uncharacterized protein n=1 Tax=Rubroshorea leprosula TaxID=152421 RepID=A0AAV5L474_9ROSI|nr:hypothetical protein SLEP1_g40643 [Rubroshorea leprosula]
MKSQALILLETQHGKRTATNPNLPPPPLKAITSSPPPPHRCAVSLFSPISSSSFFEKWFSDDDDECLIPAHYETFSKVWEEIPSNICLSLNSLSVFYSVITCFPFRSVKNFRSMLCCSL